jgi:hypothetical protein
LTLGALVVTVVLTGTTVIAAIVLATIGLVTGGLTAVGSSVALATIRAAIAAVARATQIGAGMARSTSRVLGSARPTRVGVGAGMRDGIRQGGPVREVILLLLKGLERQDVRVKFIIGHRLITERKSRCDGIEFFSKSSDDVVDELDIGERRTDMSQMYL